MTRIPAILILLSSAALAADPDLKITVSPSTNTKGYDVSISPTGKVEGTSKTLSKQLTDKLFRDARSVGAVDQIAAAHCMKSASFGTTTMVQFNGRTSPDLSCGSEDPKAAALWEDVKQALAYLNAGSRVSTAESHP